jgi:hybrid cluster-associated redox disulfide protein
MTEPTPQNETTAAEPVRRNTLIARVLDTRPDAGRILREAFALPCEECVIAETETIEEGARYYGHDADAIVAKLNECKWAPPSDADPATPGGA